MADPEILLPQHGFLYNTDFAALGSGPTSHHLLWLAEMEAAVATSWLALSGTLMPEAMTFFSLDNPARLLWECLTACKALSRANAKGKGTNDWIIRSLDD